MVVKLDKLLLSYKVPFYYTNFKWVKEEKDGKQSWKKIPTSGFPRKDTDWDFKRNNTSGDFLVMRLNGKQPFIIYDIDIPEDVPEDIQQDLDEHFFTRSVSNYNPKTKKITNEKRHYWVKRIETNKNRGKRDNKTKGRVIDILTGVGGQSLVFEKNVEVPEDLFDCLKEPSPKLQSLLDPVEQKNNGGEKRVEKRQENKEGGTSGFLSYEEWKQVLEKMVEQEGLSKDEWYKILSALKFDSNGDKEALNLLQKTVFKCPDWNSSWVYENNLAWERETYSNRGAVVNIVKKFRPDLLELKMNLKKFRELNEFQKRKLIASLDAFDDDISSFIYELYKHKLVYCGKSQNGGKWFRFDEHKKLWVEETGRYLRSEMNNIGKYYLSYANTLGEGDERKDKAYKCYGMLKIWKYKTTYYNNCLDYFEDLDFPNKLDQYQNILPVKNGLIVDLTSGITRERERSDYCTFEAPNEYNIGADYKPFENFVKTLMLEHNKGEDCPKTRFIKRFLGYCLTRLRREELITFFTGAGGNGKSVLKECVQNAFGNKIFHSGNSLMVTKTNKDNRIYYLETQKSSILCFDEIDENAHFDMVSLREIASSEYLTGKMLYENHREFRALFTPLFLINVIPNIDNTSNMRRRICTVDFKASFVDNPKFPNEFKKDTRLKDKMLTSEILEGVMRWVIEGAVLYNKEGMGEVPEEFLEYKDDLLEADDPIKSIVDEFYEITGNYDDKVLKNEVQRLLKTYVPKLTNNRILHWFRSNAPQVEGKNTSHNGVRGRYWCGLRTKVVEGEE